LDNPSLRQASQYGMAFHFVNRADYRLKEKSIAIEKILSSYPDYAQIPEGGSHKNALIGVGEIVDELHSQSNVEFDYVICSVGTGTTFAGLAQSFKGELIGINVLKNKSIEDNICELLEQSALENQQHILYNYHFGGYAKYTDELIQFMHDLYNQYDLKTDVIYTSKLFYALLDLLNKDYFKPNSRVMIYHSGGLQGNAGMNYRFPGLIQF